MTGSGRPRCVIGDEVEGRGSGRRRGRARGRGAPQSRLETVGLGADGADLGCRGRSRLLYGGVDGLRQQDWIREGCGCGLAERTVVLQPELALASEHVLRAVTSMTIDSCSR